MTKQSKQKRKEQKKSAQKAKNLIKRTEFYNKLLKISNIYNYVSKLPHNIKNYLYNISWPQIAIDTTNADHPELKIVENNIKYQLENNYIAINNTKVSISEIYGLYGIYDGLNTIFHNSNSLLNKTSPKKFSIPTVFTSKKIKDQCVSSIQQAGEARAELFKILSFIDSQYLESIAFFAAKETLADFSYDKIGLYPALEIRKTEGKKNYPAIVIKNIFPKQESLLVDGTIRKLYRCYTYSYTGICPSEIKEGLIGNDKPLPVYIQDHAINRLFERLNLSPQGYGYDAIGRSIFLGKIAGADEHSYLLEYDYYTTKLGYLVISNCGDFALIRSFKFITMTGTPEFYKLKKALRGSREDFEYLGLDSLDILNSDIAKDDKLREIFEKCDLGHLINIAKIVKFQKPERVMAEDIKKHFML